MAVSHRMRQRSNEEVTKKPHSAISRNATENAGFHKKQPSSKINVFTGNVAAPSLPISFPGQFGRVAIMGLTPNEQFGIFPARVELGEAFQVTGRIFMEGRQQVGATAKLYTPRGHLAQSMPMTCINPGLDLWSVMLQAGQHSTIKPWESAFSAIRLQLGDWTVKIEGWEDSYLFWLHDATIKVRLNDDTSNALLSGANLFRRWREDSGAHLTSKEAKTLRQAAKLLSDDELEPQARLKAADNPAIRALHQAKPLREGLSTSDPLMIRVERPGSSYAAWYQFFPRSEGAHVDETTGHIVQGALRSSMSGLKRAASQGFDIVYLPPIFPIGVTHRKGPDNSLKASSQDPGSPFAIGSSQGGHDTVDPVLGTMDDFKDLCAEAHRLGLEISLDFALQCSPDHPWVKEHPNWFSRKPDGTIAFAENPPKKYQDIYPIDFNADMSGIEHEVERILNLWITAGVSAFRIDNPHTKPIRFWQDVIASVTKKHPEVIFLAEAFTRPAMMRALSYAGFTQSHSYFPWRNTKAELEEYLITTNSDQAYYQHNTFWPTTPDILTDYIRDNGIAGHAVRAVLAAMGSPSWGIYSGYELIEDKQRPGAEEHSENEKYQIKLRNWKQADRYGVAKLLRTLNAIRNRHPACHSYHNLSILESSDPNIIAFARHTPAAFTTTGKSDTLVIVVNLDGKQAHQACIGLNPTDFMLPADRPVVVTDELTGRQFQWGNSNFVSLAPWADVAHILKVQY